MRKFEDYLEEQLKDDEFRKIYMDMAVEFDKIRIATEENQIPCKSNIIQKQSQSI